MGHFNGYVIFHHLNVAQFKQYIIDEEVESFQFLNLRDNY